jgi:hypothetical protein
MKLHRLFGYFFSIVAFVGLCSQLIWFFTGGKNLWYVISVAFFVVMFLVSGFLSEKVGRWMQIILLYVICFTAITLDFAYGDTALILGFSVFLGQVYRIIKKRLELFYGCLIIAFYSYGFFWLGGDVLARLVNSFTNALIVMMFLGGLSIGVKYLRKERK